MKDRWLFKAKTETGEWVIGNLHLRKTITCIDSPLHYIKIIPDTICQCTGMKDCEGNLVFENDIVECEDWNPKQYVVGYDNGAFYFAHKDIPYTNDPKYLEKFKIIGNIHDKEVKK